MDATFGSGSDVSGDELVLFEVRVSDVDDPEGSQTAHLEVVQRTRIGWETRYSMEENGSVASFRIGESDGIPGDEILVGPRASGQIERLTLSDGEIVTACEQVCPTKAITFGDIRDESTDKVRIVLEPRSRTVDPELLEPWVPHELQPGDTLVILEVLE